MLHDLGRIEFLNHGHQQAAPAFRVVDRIVDRPLQFALRSDLTGHTIQLFAIKLRISIFLADKEKCFGIAPCN